MWKITITCLILLGYSVLISCGKGNSDKKGTGSPCGQNGTKPAGAFKLNASNFTGECIWWITPPPLPNGTAIATISLFMHLLYLHDDDVITVFKNENDLKNDNLSIIEPLRGGNNGSVTIFTKESKLLIKLKGNPNATYARKFEGEYHGHVCTFSISPDIQIIYSPLHANGSSDTIECTYTYHKDQHTRSTRSFTFEEFDMNSSEVSLKQSTLDGLYKHVTPVDFFPLKNQQLEIDIKIPVPSNDSFRLRLHKVDNSCYQYSKFINEDTFIINSPANMLNNGSIDVTECRWIFEHSDPKQILGVMFNELHFDDSLDIIAINDGGSELSPPLLQVTASSGNITKNQVIRSTGPYLWMAFKPITYASMVKATVTAHSQGGHHKGSGNISVTIGSTDDPVFLLEVEEDKIVLLKFWASDFPLPATLSIYDGFDKTNLLATLHGDVWYPVLSKSNKMMLIASNFGKGKFDAEFEGVPASCFHMSTISNENYILSGNCNKSCLWVVPPQEQPNKDLLLNLQFLALAEGDEIKILKLDAVKTELGTITSSMDHVPQLMTPANVGALVEIIRAPCTKESDVVVVGHSSYLPACGKDMNLASLDTFQISSPLHPDTYPVFAACRWKISTAKDNLVHFAFHSLKLAPNHCVTITHTVDNKTETYEGSILREDLFLTGESVVEFNSANCKKSKDPLSLASSEGFVLNGTVSDCGSVFSGKGSGSFSFSVPANKSLCIWKVSIPETNQDTSNVVNVISYSVTKSDESGNYELLVYDGDSVREKEIFNTTNFNIWSRTNNLIFIYKRIDATKPSSILTIKVDTISCNATMQCENRLCMHPDWKCNGINDCGDFSDERNCNAVPIPPTIELMGYSSSAFWGTIFAMLILGAALGVGVPFCYQKYKNGQYRRFGEISIIE